MKNKTKLFLSLIAILSMAGCSSSSDPKLRVQPTEYVDELPDKKLELPNNNGSLYGQGDKPLMGLGSANPLWGDRKALNVNDLVTVVISEATEASSSGSRSTNKDSSLSLGTEEDGITGLTATTGAGAGGLLKEVAKGINKVTNLGIKAGSSSSFSGGGDATRSESFETRVTVRVLKVMMNDTYYIEGTKQILINGEKQYLKVGGVIRAEDIGSNNEINSDKIADAKIFYTTDGDIKDGMEKGWGSKAIETIWPF
jgi:flagellar L-ring protein precursor FlgH